MPWLPLRPARPRLLQRLAWRSLWGNMTSTSLLSRRFSREDRASISRPKRVIRTAVRTAKATAIEALKDYAVQKAIQKGVEKAVQQAAVQSAASSFGGIGGAALSGFGGFGGGAKPGFQFVVLETAEAALKAVAGEAMFLIPARYRNMQLVRPAAQEGFRALESRKGRVRKGQFKRPDGPAMRDQVAWRLVQTTTRGAVYEVAQALESGAHYALVDGSDSAFDFSVR